MNAFLWLCNRYWAIFTLIALVVITVGSLLPLSELPAFPGSDKTHHLVAYAGLVFFTALRRPKYWALLVLGFAIWSGAIELIQPFVNRYGEWVDVLANCVGLVIGIIIAQCARHWLKKDV